MKDKNVKESDVRVKCEEAILPGILRIPENALGIVLFVHGSGSSRFSPRNQYVANVLNQSGVATLLIDLLTPDEESIDNVTRELRFDIPFLAERVVLTTQWLKQHQETKHLSLGYFGSSTGAAAALVAAASRKSEVKAVVSRGGRPDLAGTALSRVQAPTLLIVGGNDLMVIPLNEEAMELLDCEKKLEIVPHATHLFEEPGTLEEVARLAASWFVHHLKA